MCEVEMGQCQISSR